MRTKACLGAVDIPGVQDRHDSPMIKERLGDQVGIRVCHPRELATETGQQAPKNRREQHMLRAFHDRLMKRDILLAEPLEIVPGLDHPRQTSTDPRARLVPLAGGQPPDAKRLHHQTQIHQLKVSLGVAAQRGVTLQ